MLGNILLLLGLFPVIALAGKCKELVPKHKMVINVAIENHTPHLATCVIPEFSGEKRQLPLIAANSAMNDYKIVWGNDADPTPSVIQGSIHCTLDDKSQTSGDFLFERRFTYGDHAPVRWSEDVSSLGIASIIGEYHQFNLEHKFGSSGVTPCIKGWGTDIDVRGALTL